MPSLQDIAGFVGAIVLAAYATGNIRLVEKTIFDLRKEVIQESRKPWGCPSIFNSRSCTLYEPNQYKKGLGSGRD